MPKLGDVQSMVLAAAAARNDGYAVIPATMKASVVTKVGASLVDSKFMREVRAKPGMPVWYVDEKGRDLTLVITLAGRKEVGSGTKTGGFAAEGKSLHVTTEALKSSGKTEAPDVQMDFGKLEGQSTEASNGSLQPGATQQGATFREGSKSALLVKMLSATNGVTLQAMEDATGWLPHTMRAALTGLRKKGLVLARDRQPGKHSVYRIDGSATPAASA